MQSPLLCVHSGVGLGQCVCVLLVFCAYISVRLGQCVHAIWHCCMMDIVELCSCFVADVVGMVRW